MDTSTRFDRSTPSFFTRAAWKAVAPGAARTRLPDAFRRFRLLLDAARFQRSQTARRAAAAAAGRTVPGIVIASITRRCNLDCSGCYSKSLRPDSGRGELSDDRFMELFEEALALGTGTIMLAGGEPLLRRELVRRASRLPGVLIPLFTNGTLVDDECLELFASGRVVPVFSVEGDSGSTERRRGAGIHERAMGAARELGRRGSPFGLSVTLTSENADYVLGDSFLGEVDELGASVLFLIEFVPVTPGTLPLVLKPEQKLALSSAGAFRGRRFSVITLPGDEEAFGGCLAAGRGFIHLADDGSLEACPFAPFSDSSAATASLADALDSPLMRDIRARHAELTETAGGCALWNKRGWVESLGSCGRRQGGRSEELEA